MIKKFIYYFWLKPWFRKLWCNIVLATGFWDHWLMNRRVKDKDWLERTADIQKCQDYPLIHKDSNAGKIINGKLYMHNGIKIFPDSYYGYAGTHLLVNNKGIHEPQEEFIFQQVLPYFAEGSIMLELGSFWSFYSIWFAQEVKSAKNYMLEPVELNLKIGKYNFEMNKVKGTFIKGYAGAKEGIAPDGINIYSMQSISNEIDVPYLDLLHCDIQGFEKEFLTGASSWLEEKKIGWLFISTHSEEIHQYCRNLLIQKGYEIKADIPLKDSYSVDGLLTAARPGIASPEKLIYHLKSQA
jgi:hypothetical protein